MIVDIKSRYAILVERLESLEKKVLNLDKTVDKLERLATATAATLIQQVRDEETKDNDTHIR